MPQAHSYSMFQYDIEKKSKNKYEWSIIKTIILILKLSAFKSLYMHIIYYNIITNNVLIIKIKTFSKLFSSKAL